jgi:hypothetical protein
MVDGKHKDSKITIVGQNGRFAFYLFNMKLAQVRMVAYVPQFHDRVVHRANLKTIT